MNPLGALANLIYSAQHGNEICITCCNEAERITKKAVTERKTFVTWASIRNVTRNEEEANEMCEHIHKTTGLKIMRNGDVMRFK